MKKFFIHNKLFVQISILIFLNYFISKYIYHILQGEELLYANISIFQSFYSYLSYPIVLLLLFPLYLYGLKWKNVFNEKTNTIKYFIIFVFSIYAWNIITLDFNLYFNQAYHFDRILLLILFILSFWFPISSVYFFILSVLFFNQVMYPNFGDNNFGVYINMVPTNEILILFIIYIFLKKIYHNFSILAFFIVALFLHASNYYVPGLGKILLSNHYIDWIWVNDLSDILMAKYSHGWLAELISLNSMEVIVKWVSIFAVPMQLFTFLIQTIVIFLLIHKRFSLFLFINFELLHFGILLASGIFFWQWILVNIAIVYVIQTLSKENIKKIFNYKMMLFSLSFILLGHQFFKAHKLAWYDTPLNNFNKVYIISDNNKRYNVDANLFHLYKFAWYDGLLNNFNCFLDQPIRDAWDTKSQIETELLKEISHKKNGNLKKEVYNFEKKYGTNKFNLDKQKKITKFLKNYFLHLNAYQNNKILWNYFSPPRQMYRSFKWNTLLDKKIKIKAIEIVFVKNFYNHHTHKLIFLEKKSVIINMKDMSNKLY